MSYLKMGGVTALAVSTLVFSSPVQAITLFTGNFTAGNFTLVNDTADGSVDITNAPTSITLTGGNLNGDNIGGPEGTTSFTITSPEAGILNFAWSYLSSDGDGPQFDPFRFLLNGTPTQLTNNAGGSVQSGTFSTAITIGDIFGFQILTTDNALGAASVTISQVPFEFSPVLGLGVVGGLFAAKKLMKKVKPQN